MCCEAEWKREIVQDYKWDYVNVAEFHKTDFFTRIKYIFVYIFLLKNIAIYGLDIFTAVTMLSTDHWTNAIYSRCGDDCAINVSFGIAKWVFVGCIIFSFLLLGYEAYKAHKVILSRDISYAFTNLMANDYYSLKNYDNFCLFCHINKSTKIQDDFAFFIFFTFKEWKRLLLADGPRQSINALVLYSFAYANGFDFSDLSAWWNNSVITGMLLWSMILTVLIFFFSLVLLIVAAVLYIPLLCYIQGNLKEYVCHKVDKRIGEIIKRMQHERVKRNAKLEKKLAAGGIITNSKGQILSEAELLRPTLPKVALDDDHYLKPKVLRHPSDHLGSAFTARSGARSPVEAASEEGIYPGLPPPGLNYGYNAYTSYPPPPQPIGSYESNGCSDYSSSASLLGSAAPFGVSYPPVAAPAPNSSYLSSSSSRYNDYDSNNNNYYAQQYPSSTSLAGYTSSTSLAGYVSSPSHRNLSVQTQAAIRQESNSNVQLNASHASYRPPYTRQPTDNSDFSVDMYGAPQQSQQPLTEEPSGLAYDDPTQDDDYPRAMSPQDEAPPSYSGSGNRDFPEKSQYQPHQHQHHQQSQGYRGNYDYNHNGNNSGSGCSSTGPNARSWGHR